MRSLSALAGLAMPLVAFVCRLASWFVLGAGAAGALFFARIDGLGVAVAAFLAVLSLTLSTLLWAVGQIAAETARLNRRLTPAKAAAPAPSAGWPPWRRRAAAPAAPRPVPADTADDAREMTADELAEFYGRPSSLSAHRAARTDRG